MDVNSAPMFIVFFCQFSLFGPMFVIISNHRASVGHFSSNTKWKLSLWPLTFMPRPLPGPCRGSCERDSTSSQVSDQSFSQGQCFNPYYLSSLLNSLFKINITSESCASLSDFYPSSFFSPTFRESNQGCSGLFSALLEVLGMGRT